MADWMDPAAALATNPYLLLQPASPDKWSMLGNLLMGAGAGISQADAAGRGWASGIAPGLMTGLQMNNAMQKQAEDQSLRRAQLAMMLPPRSATTADAWVPLGEGNGRMYLGPTYDPTKTYQRNRFTGEIRPIGSPPQTALRRLP